MYIKSYLALVMSSVTLLAACGGGDGGTSNGSGVTSVQGTAGNTQLAAGALDGKWACVGGPLTLGQLINGNFTDNQIIQKTYTTNITFLGLQYFSFAGAIASALSYNTGVIKGAATEAYYYGKVSLADKLIYQRYLPVLSQGPKIGVATLAAEVSKIERHEFSLDANGKLLISYYAPTPLPDNLTYSAASGGPGEIGVTTTTCSKI